MDRALMRKAIELAIGHVREGKGGPFGALVAKNGAIVATGTTDDRTTFSLSYVPHALTSLLAFAIAVASAGLYSIGVSVARERLDVRGAIAVPRRSQPLAPAMLRVLLWTGGVTMVLGAVAAVFKVQQHL